MSSKELKAMARISLNGHYSIFIGAFLLYSMITSVPTTILSFMLGPTASASHGYVGFPTIASLVIYIVATLILSLILSIFLLGFYKMALNASRGYPVQFADIFYGFRHQPDRIILLQFLMWLIQMVTILPGALFISFGAVKINDSTGLALMLIGSLLLVVGLVIAVYFLLTFSQAMFLMADYDDLSSLQSMKASKEMMRGHKGRLFYIELSFLGYYLLSVLSCGLALLWTMPYQYMVMANFYRDLNGEYQPNIPVFQEPPTIPYS